MGLKNVAVIGAGLWGKAQAAVFADHPGVDLVAICDLVADRARGLAEAHGARPYTDLERMLATEALDAVGIATPDHLHRDVVIAAARAGAAVLVEKPLATTIEDAEAIAAACREHGTRLMVDFHSRYSPPLHVAKDAIDRDELGSLVSAYFRLNDSIEVPLDMLAWATKSSILWFLGSHAVDTLRWFTGSEVTRVYAVELRGVLASKGLDVADGYQTIIEFASGVVATLENNWIVPRSHPNINDIKINLIGSEGMIDMDLTNHGAVRRFTRDRMDFPDVFVQPRVHGRPTGFAHASIRDFCDRLITGEEFVVGLPDGLNVTRVVCAIQASAREHVPVNVCY